MGFPRFYWYPAEGYIAPWTSGSGDVIKVDIDEPISDIQLSMKRTANDSITYSMKKHRRHFKPYIEVRVIHERFNDDALARELYSMESHLQKGNHVGFSADRTKTWASWCGSVGAVLGDDVIDQGDSSFNVWGSPVEGSNGRCNIFKHWESAGNIATGDVVQTDGTLPSFHHEELVINSSTSLGSTSRDGVVHVDSTHTGHVRYNYSAGSVVRYRDFFPYLCLPQSSVGKPILTQDHRITYTFDAIFHYYPGWMGITQRVTDPPTGNDYGIQQGDRVFDGSLGAIGGLHPEIDSYTGIGDSYADSVIGLSWKPWGL